MESIKNYLNMMIFIIIAKAITIFLLVLLIFKPMQEASYVIITLQLGLVVIVIVGLIIIARDDSKKAALKAAMHKSKAYLDSCPHYYVREYDNADNIICKNKYTTPDNNLSYAFYKQGAVDLNVTSLVAEESNMEQLCNQVNKYDNFPWIEFKAKCDTL